MKVFAHRGASGDYPENTILINSFLNAPLLTGAFFLCYNIVGMFVRFHPIPRVKPFFGVAFFK